jgi:cytochrome o ubiquinol oxidase subunit 2
MMACLALSLSGCDLALMDPKGPLGVEERNIILLATGLMLIVVVPVIIMVFAFAWRYRASNKAATYAPDWEHSNAIEAVVWIVPCLIIIALATVTWTSTHALDPYKPLASEKAPVEVEVVSLDWKWLFIYPDLKIASVNELAFPAGTPVHFKMTSGSVMNSLFVPQLGTMVYTMAGMQTQLSLLAANPGEYPGLSSNFSGDGFSDMRFMARALSDDDFQSWVEHARASGTVLSQQVYRELEKPSEKVPVAYYGDIDPMVFHHALNKCADGATCTDDQMAMNANRDAFGNQDMCAIVPAKGL